MATTSEIAQLALDVLEAEKNYTNAKALRLGTDAALLVTLQAAQAAYEAAILTRTNAVGAIA